MAIIVFEQGCGFCFVGREVGGGGWVCFWLGGEGDGVGECVCGGGVLAGCGGLWAWYLFKGGLNWVYFILKNFICSSFLVVTLIPLFGFEE